MRYVLLTAIILSTSLIAYAGNREAKAKKMMKQLGLQESEMYYTTKQELAPKYAKDGELDFPNNHIYNAEGHEVIAQYGERQVPLLDCFSAMVRDLNRYVNDTGGIVYTTAANTLQDEHKLFRPVFQQPERKTAQHTVLIYYPQGLPMVKKYYKELAAQITEYRKQEKDIAIYFVIVPILKK